MGYGFEFRVDPAGGENRIACMMKDGVNTGVICRLHDYPSTNSLVAILANQECPLYQIVQDIEKLLF